MTIVEPTTPVTLEPEADSSPSMEQLRKLMENPDAEIPEEGEAKAPATGTGEVPKEPKAAEPVTEPELPKGVQKRIDAEKAKQEELDRLINEHVGRTKAKQDELAKLTGAQGSEPVKTPKPEEKAGNPPPLAPDFLTFEGTAEEFAAALAKYHQDYPVWLQKQTRETVAEEFRRKQDEDAAKARWDSAVAEHGDKWEPAAKALRDVAPESMQDAISQLENWSKVAVYLASNPSELAALADKFKANPIAATAHLGRIEERITAAKPTPPVPSKPKVAPIPPPLSSVEAPAESGTGDFDYETASPAQRRAYFVRNGLLE